MATYDLTTGVPSEIVAGDILNAPYSGSVLQMLLPAGKFKLETWGAQGGSYSDSLVGGNGGYACGTLTLNASVTIFIRTGGKGGSVTSGATAGSGGFNGGGAGGTGAVSNGVAGSGGGGCSDVRVGTDDVDHSLLCAGGGGGSGGPGEKGGQSVDSSTAASGGAAGADGSTSSGSSNNYSGSGGAAGTSTAGGTGGAITSNSVSNTDASYECGGGGGGGAGFFGGGGGGGGSTSKSDIRGTAGASGQRGTGGAGGEGASGRAYYGSGGGGGGGGSSFALSASATVPSGYQLGAEYYLADTVTKNGNESITLPTTGATNTGVPGNGYVRITVLEVKPKVGAPVDLRAVSVGYDSISIAWDAGENAVGYKVSRNGVLVSDQTALTYTDFNVAYLTSYTYSVLSYNADGEESASVSITVRTSYPPPPKPTGFHVIGGVQTAIILAWNASPEEVTFSLKRDGVEVYRGGKLTYTDSGLTKGTEYRYTLTAITQYGETSTDAFMAATKTAIERITDRTAQDVAARRPKGHYNALDLIRVGEAMVYAKGLLQNSGYAVSINVRLDWQLDDIPTQAQMGQYISSVKNLRHAMSLLATTPAAPDSMDGLGYSGANNIEKILEDVEYTVHHVFSCLWRAGQFDAWAGDRRPFSTANSDMGRTWEELDAMNTTWANWEVATWYLLLYGNLKEEGVVS